MKPPSGSSLPPLAMAFLASRPGENGNRLVRLFHNWLDERGLRYGELTPALVDEFLAAPTGVPITALTRNGYRYMLCRLLDFLHAKRAIRFDAAWLRVRRQILPQPAEAFLSSLEPTLKPSSVRQYRSSVRLLHNWLRDRGRALEDLDRQELAAWLKHLYDRGQAPATRVNVIAAVRVYLRVLEENGVLRHPADELIRRTDFPKLPAYLPRPLPPSADDVVCRRLARSRDRLQQALLLMRWTGLRIGELASLPVDCVRVDNRGRRFLKVPLGKLDNERLVPLDSRAFALVSKLRRTGREGRQWLVETARGCKTQQSHYRQALRVACAELELAEPMTTHRLRHTYATTLLNAGMSLMGVMKLLGHRDYRMTIRYTEITLETVGKEYFAALKQLEVRYAEALKRTPASELDPDKALADISRWVQSRAGADPEARHRAELLVLRLKRIRQDLARLQPAGGDDPG